MLIRHADPHGDAAGCLVVYAPFADASPASFEERAPTLEEFERRIERIGRTHAFLVVEESGVIAGFAYAGPHRERAAYRWATESSVYLAEGFRGRGLGRTIYEVLLGLLEHQGYRRVLAGITVPNQASVALHLALGFERIGVQRRIGWKAGAWRDVMWLERPLGPETEDPEQPPPPGPPVRLAAPIEL